MDTSYRRAHSKGNPGPERPKPEDPGVEFDDPNVPTGAGTPDQSTSDKGKLPFLGTTSSNGVWFGFALLLMGLGVLWSTRRRTKER